MFIFNLMHSANTPAIGYVPKKEIAMKVPDLLAVVNDDEEDEKIEPTIDPAFQSIMKAQTKNEKKLQKMLKFFKSEEDEGLDADTETFALKEEDDLKQGISELADIPLKEEFEEPKRRKGRPRKLKAIENGEEDTRSISEISTEAPRK